MTGERASQGGHVAAELIGNVSNHPVVRSRGGREDWDSCGQPGQDRSQPTVVRSEVVAPVRDAVRLVDHEQPDRSQGRQDSRDEGVVAKSLWRDQQDVDNAVGEPLFDRTPIMLVRRVDGLGAQCQPVSHRDLVAHQ